ncbi:hypothetical protein DQP56_23000, partial [Mycolicibacter senuensis]
MPEKQVGAVCAPTRPQLVISAFARRSCSALDSQALHGGLFVGGLRRGGGLRSRRGLGGGRGRLRSGRCGLGGRSG